jgi:hypothetical protein
MSAFGHELGWWRTGPALYSGGMRLFRLGVVAAGALALPSAAVAARPSMTVAPPSVVRGHVITLTGSAPGCRVGNTVTLLSRAFVRTHVFAGVPAVYAPVRRGGAFAVRTRIPAARAPGRYAVTARCGGGNLGLLRHLAVRR